MIRVCYMVDAPFLGGAERYVSRIAHALDRSRFHASLIVRESRERDDGGLAQWGEQMEAAGVPVARARMRLPFRPWDAPGILRAIEGFAPDIVHVNMPGPYSGQMGLLAPLARMAGAPSVVVTEHLPMVERLWKRALVKRVAYGYVDLALTVCHANVPYMVGRQKVPPERLRVVHNGLRDDYGSSAVGAAAAREDLGAAPSEVIVVFVGNLLRHKGLHRLVRALCEMEGREMWRLAVVGTGPEKERCQARLAALGVADRACFLGALTERDVETVLAAGDILALPSTMEGMPYVILEAMASRKPVVATDVFGIPEMVEDGVHGFVVPPDDVGALGRALARLVTDADLRSRMGSAARERFEREFTLSRQVAAIEAVYGELAWRRRRR